MAEKREPKHKRLYKDSPKLERNEKGDIKSVKPSDKEGAPSESMKKADEIQSGMDGVKMTEGLPPHVRHAHERRDMHNRHETEHSVHDNGKGGDKKEMHARHEKEYGDMHKRHDKEMAAGEKKDQDIKEGHETAKDKGK